ncbi:2-amino-4-hydroxy-6-hydroxymethyldihydropteridine diphosphokinase [Neogemmobacter tilapiae]|uniref:2-amino-4-hydroxy-6-hydroxymethyldihydropteridine pyrophosphokinase n=1 Tax=Neogemmobacter tilapiae TaxID=875041 RepID=A0A918WP41_9RHOB|nr:2-amino-4-hydroxy-6-hydroxymethyldihydropteridine diphosphokinase [Gemmobacter tilapiae]GHC64607.1 2-amino-4-hydroxy-6-hydroxymethyldihydropteridine pyrophosphokinase [Gemmobacter tilapiae]
MDANEKLALIALGANLPFGKMPPVATLLAALSALAEEGLEIHAKSKMYSTPCFPAGVGPDYVNAAAALKIGAKDDVASVLQALHRVEAQFGRERRQRWGMRTLDLDLLAVEDLILPDDAGHRHWMDLEPESQIGQVPDQLILPHPRLQDRAFVLVPLAEIAPNWRHPVTGKTVQQMLATLSIQDRDAIKPLE